MRPSPANQLAEAFSRFDRQALGAPVVPVPIGQCSRPEQATRMELAAKEKRVESQERLYCPSLPTTHGVHRRDCRASEGLEVQARLATDILHSNGHGSALNHLLAFMTYFNGSTEAYFVLGPLKNEMIATRLRSKRSIFSGMGCVGLINLVSPLDEKPNDFPLVFDVSICKEESLS